MPRGLTGNVACSSLCVWVKGTTTPGLRSPSSSYWILASASNSLSSVWYCCSRNSASSGCSSPLPASPASYTLASKGDRYTESCTLSVATFKSSMGSAISLTGDGLTGGEPAMVVTRASCELGCSSSFDLTPTGMGSLVSMTTLTFTCDSRRSRLLIFPGVYSVRDIEPGSFVGVRFTSWSSGMYSPRRALPKTSRMYSSRFTASCSIIFFSIRSISISCAYRRLTVLRATQRIA